MLGMNEYYRKDTKMAHPNRPNMSYCMFENTSMAVQQLIDAMFDAQHKADLDLNQYEKDAFEKMFRLCKVYISEYARLEYGDDANPFDNGMNE